MMLLADTVAYVALLAHDSTVVEAVTSNLNINFLYRAEPGDLIGTGSLRKRGRRLSLVNVVIHDGSGRAVAEASVTYAMP